MYSWHDDERTRVLRSTGIKFSRFIEPDLGAHQTEFKKTLPRIAMEPRWICIHRQADHVLCLKGTIGLWEACLTFTLSECPYAPRALIFTIL
ncbi:hypothetical protein BC936DRAFT_140093 [Jimgerdemannia flammicorona]|uniref:Uncharacterized protein n=1 Tax=Jimgerdemannia flammicorona TaxID=994334 RepID=A0A433B2N8_9FUNG|nr:hypothetical protein BC936DRAFT_140093 [Jimgerdemannia flammicorona]